MHPEPVHGGEHVRRPDREQCRVRVLCEAINPAEDRAGVLAALASVDLVTVFATDTPIPLIERLRPEVYVKGGDYSPEMLRETEVVRGYGGEVVMVDYVPEHSTTAVVQRIREAAQRAEPDPAP